MALGIPAQVTMLTDSLGEKAGDHSADQDGLSHCDIIYEFGAFLINATMIVFLSQNLFGSPFML